MTSTKHRALAIQIFGASGAADALMTLDYFLERVGEGDLEGAIPHLIGQNFERLQAEILLAMSADGLANTDLYLDQMKAWSSAAKDMVENGVPTVERLGYDPVNLGSAFHQGKLYYRSKLTDQTYSFRFID